MIVPVTGYCLSLILFIQIVSNIRIQLTSVDFDPLLAAIFHFCATCVCLTYIIFLCISFERHLYSKDMHNVVD